MLRGTALHLNSVTEQDKEEETKPESYRRSWLPVGTQHPLARDRIGRRDKLSHIKWERVQTYRSGRAWGDVEEGHPVLGALRNGEVFWDCVKRLQMNQHLICLVDAEREKVVSHKSPRSPWSCPSQPSACIHSIPKVLGAHLHQHRFPEERWDSTPDLQRAC